MFWKSPVFPKRRLSSFKERRRWKERLFPKSRFRAKCNCALCGAGSRGTVFSEAGGFVPASLKDVPQRSGERSAAGSKVGKCDLHGEEGAPRMSRRFVRPGRRRSGQGGIGKELPRSDSGGRGGFTLLPHTGGASAVRDRNGVTLERVAVEEANENCRDLRAGGGALRNQQPLVLPSDQRGSYRILERVVGPA